MSFNNSSYFINTSDYLVCGSENMFCSRFDAMLPAELNEKDSKNDAEDLHVALSLYQLINRRRYLTFEELIHLLQELGYRKQ